MHTTDTNGALEEDFDGLVTCSSCSPRSSGAFVGFSVSQEDDNDSKHEPIITWCCVCARVRKAEQLSGAGLR